MQYGAKVANFGYAGRPAADVDGKKSKGPVVDPKGWAESRKQKMERAERLRGENRKRLQAQGLLPFDDAAAALQQPTTLADPACQEQSPVEERTLVTGRAPAAAPVIVPPWARDPAPAAVAAPVASPVIGGLPAAGQRRLSVEAPQAAPAGALGSLPVAGQPLRRVEASQQPPGAVAPSVPQLSGEMLRAAEQKLLGTPSAGVRAGHTQEDLADLFKHALAVGACQDVAQELRSYGYHAVADCSKNSAADVECGYPGDEATLLLAPQIEATLQPALECAQQALDMGRQTSDASVCHFGSPEQAAPTERYANTLTHSHGTTNGLTSMLDCAYENHGETGRSMISTSLAEEKTLDLRKAGAIDEHTLDPQSLIQHTPAEFRIPKILPRPPVKSSASDSERDLLVSEAPRSVPAPTPETGPVSAPAPGVVPAPAAAASEGPPASSSMRDTGQGFRVEYTMPPADEECGQAEGGGVGGVDGDAWWADGPGPSWMQQSSSSGHVVLEPAIARDSEISSSSHVVQESAVAREPELSSSSRAVFLAGPGVGVNRDAELHGELTAEDEAPCSDATFFPAGQARKVESERPSSSEARKPEWQRPSSREGEARNLELQRPSSREGEACKFELQNASSREAHVSAQAQGQSDEPAVDPWLMNLRDGEPEDDFTADDPMVFGKPKPKPRRKSVPKQSKPHSVPAGERRDSDSLPEGMSEETRAWLGGLRGSAEVEEESHEDPDSFGKPRVVPRKRTKPPRPSSFPGQVTESGGGGSRPSSSGGGGSRPSSSGYFSKRSPAVGQQMPEGLRKRLEQNEQRAEHHLPRRDSRSSPEGHCGDQGYSSPEQAAISSKPSRAEVKAALLARARNAAVAEAECGADERRVRLPPIDPDAAASARGRRCQSQPPVPQDGGGGGGSTGSRRGSQRKQARAHSIGAGGHDEEQGGRQMFDKNTLRTNGREVFVGAIAHWKQQNCGPAAGKQDVEVQRGAVQVYVRKRPMFEKEETKNGDYDVCSILPGRPVSTQLVMHNCLFQADLKTPFINHLTFDFDHVWDSNAESADVYQCAAAPLVRSAIEGGVSTMFMFGQTGSGKTFTMSAIQEMAAQDLFQGSNPDEPSLAVQFIELRGNRVFDLLAQSIADPRKKQFGDMRPELRLREHGDGSYNADGASDMFPKTAEELISIFEMAQSRRATSATEANDVSSRSHAVCTMRLFQSEGQLMLVDCAGTERRKDSMFHSKERQQEGAEINASLHALKECVRLLITQGRVPSHSYRASSLTKILADSFSRGSDARFACICTASPCASDTEHTVATLRMGMALAGRGNEQEDKMMLADFVQARKKPRLAHPKQWTPDQILEWLATVGGGQFIDLIDALPETFTGQMLVRLTESRCVQLCGDQRRGRRLFDLLHQEIHNVEASRKNSH